MHTQSPSTDSQITSSPLLRALEQVREQALVQETRAFIYESEQTPRGIFGPSTPKSLPPEQVHTALENLDKVSDQIKAVQTLLQEAPPELLKVLDEAIRGEYRRTNRTALLMNILFTIIGALLGYLLPLAIQWLFSLG